MPLQHPKGPKAGTGPIDLAAIFGLQTGHIPRHTPPAGEMPADAAYQIIRDELMLDGNGHLNLAAFVTTVMEPQAEKLMAGALRQEHDRQGRVSADR